MTDTYHDTLAEMEYWNKRYKHIKIPYRPYLHMLPEQKISEYVGHWIRDMATSDHPAIEIDLLDVGCGAGPWMAHFAERYGIRVAGMDYADNALSAARRNLNSLGIKYTLYKGDVTELPPLPAFDIVYSRGVVEHWVDMSDIIHPMAGWLKPGGTMITIVPNFSGIYRPLERRVNSEALNIHNLCNLAQLMDAHTNAGLTVLDASPLGVFGLHIVTTARWLKRIGKPWEWIVRKAISGVNYAVWVPSMFIPIETRALSPMLVVTAQKPVIVDAGSVAGESGASVTSV